MLYSFKNDYSIGAHPKVIQWLSDTNTTLQDGYGNDEYSARARALIQQKINNPDARVFFLSGGTQTNLITISFLLRVHEAVISARTGHIFANETGAIEATGHKVITVDTPDGKLRPDDILETLAAYTLHPHVVKPRLVYISNSTELGTVYTREELRALYATCRKHNLLLYMDGARLGHALMSERCDLDISDLSTVCDIFYLGGTKNGALLGEALVFNIPDLAHDFEFSLKQKGALLAKGRLLAGQFIALLEDDLYFSLAEHANQMASKLADALSVKGYHFLTEPATNQLFPIIEDTKIDMLSNDFLFYVWKRIDEDHSAIRLITSWATTSQAVDAFIAAL